MSWKLVGLLVLIISCANLLFHLAPWVHISGKFNVKDVGLGLLGLLFMCLMLRGVKKNVLNNGFSLLVVLFLIFSLLQASMVSFNFGQSVFDGVIIIRHQYYYLSFFVFLILLDSKEKITQLLNVILILALILTILGFINYLGITVFYHKWAEGHGIRSGIERAFIPGMDIIGMGLIWSLAQWMSKRSISVRREIMSVMLILAHILRQSRGRLLGLVVVIIALLLFKRRFKALSASAVVFLAFVGVTSLFMEENILLTPFTSAFEDVADEEGTWAPRLDQLELDIQVFMEHPWLGSGSSALRQTSDMSAVTTSRLHALANLDDLGYTHWLKAYGIPGVVWLVVLYSLIIRYMSRVLKNSDNEAEPIALASCGYILFVIVSFVTLPHFMRTDEVILVCLTLAILVRVRQFSTDGVTLTQGKDNAG